MDFWQNYGAYVAMALAVIFVTARIIWRYRDKRPRSTDSATVEENARIEWELVPKCVCGDIATEPTPVLQRTRGAYDYARLYFGAAPKYKRVIDHMRPPTLCKAHAHVADAKLDQFIFSVRSRYAELNSAVSADAAAFEQESLRILVADSLTELQKRATRKTAGPLRALPKKASDETGTDG